MKLENQYCSLPKSKKLKDLGINQNTQWYWLYPEREGYISTKTELIHSSVTQEHLSDNEGDEFDHAIASAYSVAELGVMLPKELDRNDGRSWSFYHRHCWKGESVGYSSFGVVSLQQDWFATEAESRADMLIHLLETEIITPEECNKRLLEF